MKKPVLAAEAPATRPCPMCLSSMPLKARRCAACCADVGGRQATLIPVSPVRFPQMRPSVTRGLRTGRASASLSLRGHTRQRYRPFGAAAARAGRVLLPVAAWKNSPSAAALTIPGVGWGLPASGEPTVQHRGFADRRPRTYRRRRSGRLRGRFTPVADHAAHRSRRHDPLAPLQLRLQRSEPRQRCRSRAACERADAERSRKLLAARCSRRLHPSVIRRVGTTRGPIPRITVHGKTP